MKPRWYLIAVCLLAGVWLAIRTLQHRSARPDQQHSAAIQSKPSNVLMDLRGLALQGTRANFGLPPGSKTTQPFVVVMDFGLPEGSTTVVAIADGSASVYHSMGSGSIGGGQSHESIRNAALTAVRLADDVQPLMHPATDYPLPPDGQVDFYAVTDAGVFSATSSEADVLSHQSPFSKLGAAGQEIITQYGLLQKK